VTDADALARFISISALLTGFDDLDARVAAAHLVRLRERPTYRAGLDAVLARVSPDAPPTRALIDELKASSESGATLNAIVLLWYSGAFFPDDGDAAVRRRPSDFGQVGTSGYREGLVWRAAGVQPMGYSTEPYGAWAQPPSPEASS
jgi:hypothetical protein